MNDMIREDNTSQHQLAIVEKFEDFAHYLYPILNNTRRAHGTLRDRVLNAMFEEVELLNQAGKSGQISKLYLADAGLGTLRFYLRFMAHPSRKLISLQQHKVASVQLAETGKMLGAWIKTMKGKG